MLYDGELTRWRRTRAGYSREVFRARVEEGCPAAFGAVQSLSGGSSDAEALRAYAVGNPDIAPGDYVAPGARGEADPSDAPGVRRVVLATAYTLGGVPHHVEVKAR